MIKRITAAAFAVGAACLMTGAQTNYWIPDVEFISPVTGSCQEQDYVDLNIKFNIGFRTDSIKVFINGCRIANSDLRITSKGVTARLTRRHCLNICNKECSECHLTNTIKVKAREWVGNERQYGHSFFYLGQTND